jgi:hypothetical protein
MGLGIKKIKIWKAASDICACKFLVFGYDRYIRGFFLIDLKGLKMAGKQDAPKRAPVRG